jgi:predicted dehydrogenase
MMLKVAIVGAGGIGNIHAGIYQKHPETEVVAVCDLIKEKADAFAEKFGCKAFYSVDKMLDSIEIDMAGVTTAGEENGSHHYEPTMKLLGAGIPVLGEKPISNDIEEAKEMVALGKEKGVRYGINLNHRFTPAFERAKGWIDEGRLGEVNMIQMRLWINNPNESSPWFHMRALHPHSVDIMRNLGGEVKKVQAFLKKGKDRKIWSNAQVNILYENGVLGHLVGSYDAGGSYGLETLDVVGSDGRFVIEEACEVLTFYPRFSNQVEVYHHLGGMQSFGDTFESRITKWIEQNVAKVKPDEIDGKAEDALKAQTVIEAAIKSWQEDAVVDVSEI